MVGASKYEHSVVDEGSIVAIYMEKTSIVGKNSYNIGPVLAHTVISI